MSNGMPSMTALLGLLAVAGFQNRDKIAEMLGGLGQGQPAGAPAGGGFSGGTGQVGSGGSAGQGGGGFLGGGGFAQGGASGGGQGGGLGGLLGHLGGAVGGGGAGGLLGGGLGELVNQFKQNGHGDTVESWVRPGPNQPIAPNQLEQAIGPDVLATLTQHTGLSREELLSRLSKNLPEAVDKYTPDGRLPPSTGGSSF